MATSLTTWQLGWSAGQEWSQERAIVPSTPCLRLERDTPLPRLWAGTSPTPRPCCSALPTCSITSTWNTTPTWCQTLSGGSSNRARCRHKTWAVTARPGTLCKPLWGTSATDPHTKEVLVP